MIEIVPLPYYSTVYIYITMFMVFATLFHGMAVPVHHRKNIAFLQVAGISLLLFSVVYMGLRPISGKYFADMKTYSIYFLGYSRGAEVLVEKDITFHLFMKFTSGFLSVHQFFLLCAFLYIFPMYRVAKSFFKEYWFYGFLMLVSSFSFWTYGVNGIRNGIATSIFLLALTYRDRKWLMYAVLILSTLIHKTLLLPVIAFIATRFYNNTKTFIIGWALAIPLSLALGGFWEGLFASLGFGDDRLDAYLLAGAEGGGGSFRFDFLLYSAAAIAVGWFFVFKKGFKDPLYHQILNTYLIVNAFWVLVIRAGFSNRFAYLSWFLIALVIAYPFVKGDYFNKKGLMLGKVALAYFAFTFFMYLIYTK